MPDNVLYRARYPNEIAAREHRRTLSSYIEWAIEDSLRNVQLDGRDLSMAEEAENLWDVDAADRFARLALQQVQILPSLPSPSAVPHIEASGGHGTTRPGINPLPAPFAALPCGG